MPNFAFVSFTASSTDSVFPKKLEVLDCNDMAMNVSVSYFIARNMNKRSRMGAILTVGLTHDLIVRLLTSLQSMAVPPIANPAIARSGKAFSFLLLTREAVARVLREEEAKRRVAIRRVLEASIVLDDSLYFYLLYKICIYIYLCPLHVRMQIFFGDR